MAQTSLIYVHLILCQLLRGATLKTEEKGRELSRVECRGPKSEPLPSACKQCRLYSDNRPHGKILLKPDKTFFEFEKFNPSNYHNAVHSKEHLFFVLASFHDLIVCVLEFFWKPMF